MFIVKNFVLVFNCILGHELASPWLLASFKRLRDGVCCFVLLSRLFMILHHKSFSHWTGRTCRRICGLTCGGSQQGLSRLSELGACEGTCAVGADLSCRGCWGDFWWTCNGRSTMGTWAEVSLSFSLLLVAILDWKPFSLVPFIAYVLQKEKKNRFFNNYLALHVYMFTW